MEINPNLVCVDASLVIALLLPERFSDKALRLWEKWMQADLDITAPRLIRYEVPSVIHRKGLRGLITWDDAQTVLGYFLNLDISCDESESLPIRASELARQFQRSNTYDAFYLAQAEQFSCPFWTGDERLFNAVKDGYSLIHWLGE